MATSRSGKSKSSGLRILWIPGGRKSHPKGRFDSTNKQHVYSRGQKKSEMWSLGGSKTQRDLIEADPDKFEGPSVSGVAATACALGTATAAKCAASAAEPSENNKPPTEDASTTTPTSPSSTASTALVVSLPNSPTMGTESANIPASSQTALVTTATITAGIIEENRFSILGKDTANEIDVFNLPSPPKYDLNTLPLTNGSAPLNTSAGTTVSGASTPSPKSAQKHDTNPENEPETPTKKKLNHKHNNNNQNDINYIESISETSKVHDDEIDSTTNEREYNGKELLKNKLKQKKTKELDQLDGIAGKNNTSEKDPAEDEKVVSCLYYTLMCCECTIS